MSITVKSIFHDTENFFRNQFNIFLLIALLSTFITLFFSHIFSLNHEQILNLNQIEEISSSINFFQVLQNMTPEQEEILIFVSATAMLSNLIGNTILTGGTLLIIQLITASKRITLFRIRDMALPKLFILIFLITFLVQIGIMLFVFPGIFLAIILAFTPIIVMQEKLGIFISMKRSIKLALSNIHLVAPVVITWLVAKTLLILFFVKIFALTPNVGTVLSNTLSNLISILLLVYLFRLYMLIQQ